MGLPDLFKDLQRPMMEFKMGVGEQVGEGWETKQRACELTERDKGKRNNEEEQDHQGGVK